MKRHAAPRKSILKRPIFWVILVVIVLISGFAVEHKSIANLFSQPTATKPKPKPKPIKLTASEKKVAQKYHLSPKVTAKAHTVKVTAIGDSVMVDIVPEMKQVFPNAQVDGAVGRQFYELPTIAQNLKNEHKLANTIVVNLGTNGPPKKADISRFLKVVGNKRQVYWINTHVPTQKWQDQTNQMIASIANSIPNVHMVDWHGLSKDQPTWFAGDDVHLQTKGAIAYVGLLAKTMGK